MSGGKRGGLGFRVSGGKRGGLGFRVSGGKRGGLGFRVSGGGGVLMTWVWLQVELWRFIIIIGTSALNCNPCSQAPLTM